MAATDEKDAGSSLNDSTDWVYTINLKESRLAATKIIKDTYTDAEVILKPTLFWSFEDDRSMVRENVECAYARLADLLLANAGNHPSLSTLVCPPTRLDNGPTRHYKNRSPSGRYASRFVLGCRRVHTELRLG